MPKKVSTTQAKAELSALLAEVAAGQRVIIERRGKPLAVLLSLDELGKLEQKAKKRGKNGKVPKGEKPAEHFDFLKLVGTLGDALTDEEIDQFIADIYADRHKGMPPNEPAEELTK